MEVKAKSAPAVKRNPDPLVGRGVHWLDNDGCVCWQGHVIAALPDGYYLVELFSWVVGEPIDQVVIHLSAMAVSDRSTNGKPIFYDNVEAMNWHYENRHSHKRTAASKGRAEND